MYQGNRWSKLEWLALIFALLVAALYIYAIMQIRTANPTGFYLLALGGLVGVFFAIRAFTGRARRRRRLLAQAFPDSWRAILEKRVDFYRQLDKEERRRFEQQVQIFLAEKRVTGIKTEIDDTIRVLAAASAIIPIFGFQGWEYHNLEEVLIYPGAFDQNFRQEGRHRDVLGMVGDGAMSRVVILSKPALLSGFNSQRDGHNTGIHEFTHLIDASDGAYDGVPALLDRRYVLPWLDLVHQQMKRISKGRSALRAYGATNKEEFFAVASEYFFERPKELKKDDPELYEMLTRIFRQDRLGGRYGW